MRIFSPCSHQRCTVRLSCNVGSLLSWRPSNCLSHASQFIHAKPSSDTNLSAGVNAKSSRSWSYKVAPGSSSGFISTPPLLSLSMSTEITAAAKKRTSAASPKRTSEDDHRRKCFDPPPPLSPCSRLSRQASQSSYPIVPQLPHIETDGMCVCAVCTIGVLLTNGIRQCDRQRPCGRCTQLGLVRPILVLYMV